MYLRLVEGLEPAARHVSEQCTNNVVEADYARLKARLRPMCGLKQLSSARTVSTGHAFVQNLAAGNYAITVDLPVPDRVRIAFDELAPCL